MIAAAGRTAGTASSRRVATTGAARTQLRPAALAAYIARSARPLRALIANIARLPDNGRGTANAAPMSDDALAQVAESRIGVPAALVHDVLTAAATGQTTIADPSALLARYLDAAQRIWDYVDTWRA